VAQFSCLEITVTNQNLIQEEINRRLNSGNSCCYSVKNLSKKIKTITMPVVLYEHEIWCLTLRDEHRLRVFGPRREKVSGSWRYLHYEGPSAAIWSETNFGRTNHHHSGSSPLPHICTSPCTSAIFLNAS
jgi:hypothetical protein